MTNIAILGYGTVGQGVVEVLRTNQESINRRAEQPIQIKYVLDIKDLSATEVAKVWVTDFEQIIADASVRIVVEVMGGIQPAYDFVKRCLNAGKNVVTSNKELVAKYGPELIEIAKTKAVNFFFEASVGGGIPIIRPLNKSLTADEIFEIEGILNGTTNYILTRMQKEQVPYQAVLEDAIKLGYAERNPAADVEGHDACRKIAILSSLAYGHNVDYEHIHTEGITHVRLQDINNADKIGYHIKLLGTSKKIRGKAYAMVAPALVPLDNPLYNVNGVFNAILIKGNVIGDVMFYGQGAGKLPTASAVVADIVEACKHLDKNIVTHWYSKEMSLLPMQDIPTKYYLAVAGVKQDRIEQIFGAVRYIETEAETAFITNRSTEGDLRTKIERLKEVAELRSVIRVED